MARPLAAKRRGRWSSTGQLGWFVELAFLAWFVVAVAGVVGDVIAQLPSKPPTPAQVLAATPRAWADWTIVYGGLYRRLPEPPPELGEVWTVRSGRICGLVNSKEDAVPYMTRFFSVNLVPVLREDNDALYRRDWMDCLDSRWVELHRGTEESGFCASKFGRESVFGRGFCRQASPPARR